MQLRALVEITDSEEEEDELTKRLKDLNSCLEDAHLTLSETLSKDEDYLSCHNNEEEASKGTEISMDASSLEYADYLTSVSRKEFAEKERERRIEVLSALNICPPSTSETGPGNRGQSVTSEGRPESRPKKVVIRQLLQDSMRTLERKDDAVDPSASSASTILRAQSNLSAGVDITGTSRRTSGKGMKRLVSDFMWKVFRLRVFKAHQLKNPANDPKTGNMEIKQTDVPDEVRTAVLRLISQSSVAKDKRRSKSDGPSTSIVNTKREDVVGRAQMASLAAVQLRLDELYTSAPHLQQLQQSLQEIEETIRHEDNSWREIARESRDAVGVARSKLVRAEKEVVNARARARDTHNVNARKRRESLLRYQRSLLQEASVQTGAFLESFAQAIEQGLGKLSQSSERVLLEDLQLALHQSVEYSRHWQVIAALPESLTAPSIHKLKLRERQTLLASLQMISDTTRQRETAIYHLLRSVENQVLKYWREHLDHVLMQKAKMGELRRKFDLTKCVSTFDAWCAYHENEKKQMDAELILIEQKIADMQDTMETWIEYNLDDELGRLEFVGKTLQVGGEFRPHGLGMMTWNDGTQFLGEWQQGKLDGLGCETYSDGSSYIGQFENDKRHGLGMFSSISGVCEYIGTWTDGQRHGPGIVLKLNADNFATSDGGTGKVAVKRLLLSAFAEFEKGELIEKLHDAELENDLKRQVEGVVERAQRTVELSQELIGHIRLRAKSFAAAGQSDLSPTQNRDAAGMNMLGSPSEEKFRLQQTNGKTPLISVSPARREGMPAMHAVADNNDGVISVKSGLEGRTQTWSLLSYDSTAYAMQTDVTIISPELIVEDELFTMGGQSHFKDFEMDGFEHPSRSEEPVIQEQSKDEPLIDVTMRATNSDGEMCEIESFPLDVRKEQETGALVERRATRLEEEQASLRIKAFVRRFLTTCFSQILFASQVLQCSFRIYKAQRIRDSLSYRVQKLDDAILSLGSMLIGMQNARLRALAILLLPEWLDFARRESISNNNNVMSMVTQREIYLSKDIMRSWHVVARDLFLQRMSTFLQAYIRRRVVFATSIRKLRAACVTLQGSYRCHRARVNVLQCFLRLLQDHIEKHETPRPQTAFANYVGLLRFWRQHAHTKRLADKQLKQQELAVQAVIASQKAEEEERMRLAEEDRERRAWTAFWSASSQKQNSFDKLPGLPTLTKNGPRREVRGIFGSAKGHHSIVLNSLQPPRFQGHRKSTYPESHRIPRVKKYEGQFMDEKMDVVSPTLVRSHEDYLYEAKSYFSIHKGGNPSSKNTPKEGRDKREERFFGEWSTSGPAEDAQEGRLRRRLGRELRIEIARERALERVREHSTRERSRAKERDQARLSAYGDTRLWSGGRGRTHGGRLLDARLDDVGHEGRGDRWVGQRQDTESVPQRNEPYRVDAISGAEGDVVGMKAPGTRVQRVSKYASAQAVLGAGSGLFTPGRSNYEQGHGRSDMGGKDRHKGLTGSLVNRSLSPVLPQIPSRATGEGRRVDIKSYRQAHSDSAIMGESRPASALKAKENDKMLKEHGVSSRKIDQKEGALYFSDVRGNRFQASYGNTGYDECQVAASEGTLGIDPEELESEDVRQKLLLEPSRPCGPEELTE